MKSNYKQLKRRLQQLETTEKFEQKKKKKEQN